MNPATVATRSAAGPRRGLLVVGVAMALLAFVVVFAIGLALASRGSTSVQHFQVLVATRDIDAREQLTPDMVAVQPFIAAQAPAGAVTSFAAIKGQAAQVKILKGQPITSNLVAAAADPLDGVSAYLPIPEGYVALTIPTGEQQGVAGYIAAGDYINIIATISTSAFGINPGKTVSKTVFTNLHIIRVGPAPVSAAQGTPQKQGISSSLTVIVTACDAQYLSWVVANAAIKYELLSYKDYGPGAFNADPACPATAAPAPIGPAQVDARFGFTRI